MGEMAFNNCSKMSKFTLKYPEELKTVYKDVFANCSELTELPIGKDKTPNLTYIGSRAFRQNLYSILHRMRLWTVKS